MDTLGVIQKKHHISKLAICSLILGLIGGPIHYGVIMFLSSQSGYNSYNGKSYYPPFYQFATNPVFSFSGMCFCWLLPIVAMMLGIMALQQIHRHPSLLRGRVIAWLGIFSGSITILLVIAFYAFELLTVRI
jgi:hypothetical protein